MFVYFVQLEAFKLLVFYLVALCLTNIVKRALRVSHTYQVPKMQPQQAAQAAKLWMQTSGCTKNSRCLRCIAFASKRKKRAAPRVCTARFFRSYKLEICCLVLFFSYLHYITCSSKNKSRSKFLVSACFTHTPRRVRHFGPWLRQALFVRHLRRINKTSSSKKSGCSSF